MTEHPPQYKRDTCYFCHETDTHILELHHIVPRRFGGGHSGENLVRVCPTCHRKLENLYDERFYEALGVENVSDDGGKGTQPAEGSAHQRELIKAVKNAVSWLAKEHDEGAPVERVVSEVEAEGYDPAAVRHEIDDLKAKGEVYEARDGYVRGTW